jgi:23S rRNA pseudouridine2605 synthase
MQQPNLALHAIQESLPPPKHKRSTDEVFSEPQRLHKVLASCGFGSRRAMEDMIVAGRITVNRLPAEVGQKVGPGDEVRINGELVKVRFTEPRPRVLMYHKPAGEIVTRDDPEGRPTVFTKLPNIGNGKWINVGRLDYNTEGLLLFTNSGELANRLMHPRYEVEREYAVRIMGRMTDEHMQSLVTGVQLDDGLAKCEKVEDGGGEEEGANHWYHVVLKEGRNREVRRLFEALNLAVSRLIRTRYGTLAMPSVMKRGDLLELEAPDVAAVMDAAGLRGSGAPAGPRAPGPRHGPPAKQRRPGQQGGEPRPRGEQEGVAAAPVDGVEAPRPAHGQGPRPQGKPGNRPRGKGPRPNGNGAQGHAGGHGGQGPGQRPRGPRPDFDTTQPHSNANASAHRARGPRPDFNAPQPHGQADAGQRPPGQRPRGPRPDFDTTQPVSNANAIGLRPHGKGNPRSRPPGGQGFGNGPRPQHGPRPDFDNTQPHSNANAIGLRPHGQGPRRGPGYGGPGKPGTSRPHGPRPDFDTKQPHSNANASPFIMTTLTVPGSGSRGPETGFGQRGDRSGPRGRPAGGNVGKAPGQFRGKGNGQGPPRHKAGGPAGAEPNGNVAPRDDNRNRAPREEVNGNIALPKPPVARDDDD